MLATSTSDADLGDPSTWYTNLTADLIVVGVIVAGAFIVWLLGRLLIRTLTRGLEHGIPAGERHARKALRKARIVLDEADPLEVRLERERRRQRAGTLRSVLNSGLTVAIIVVAAMMILTEVGVPVGPLLASAGIVGVALGFGAQSIVKDLLSGIFMLAEDQYGVGDIIDVGEAVGAVEMVGLRTTKLRSLDGTVWYVPNGEIKRVGNKTQLWSRVMIEVRFTYQTDLEAARQAMLDAVAAARADEAVDAAIISEPDVPGLEAMEFNAVMLRLLVQVTPATQWMVGRAVRAHMRRLFTERGIQMAVPDQALIMDSVTPAPRKSSGRKRPPSSDVGIDADPSPDASSS